MKEKGKKNIPIHWVFYYCKYLQVFDKNCMCIEQLIRNNLCVFHSISLLEAVLKISGCKCRTRVPINHTI